MTSRRATANSSVCNLTKNQEYILFALKAGVPVNGHHSWRKLFDSLGEAFKCSRDTIGVRINNHLSC